MEALSQIYDLYSEALYRYAYRQTGDQSQAEDCVAETFNRFLNALKNGKGPHEHLKAYLYRIAHNWITDQFRRGGAPELPLEEDFAADKSENPERQVFEIIESERLRRMIALLTPDQRQVILLKYVEGWNSREIAEAIKKPLSAVKSLQHRGLQALNRMITNVESKHE